MSELSFPRIMLVDAPTFDANVRFDLNSTFGAATCVTNAAGFSLGAPTFQGDPGSVGGTYGERQITLTPRIEGPKAAALSLLSSLAREVLRWENWLLVQLDALTEPVWFHLYRSTPGALSLDEVDVEERLPDAWQTTLSLTADAFALGERITLPPMTFTQSPTGLSAALPAIRGDAPTGLRISVDPGAASGYGSQWLLNCTSGPAGTSAPVFDIGTGDAFTAPAGYAAGTIATDASYFGGSYRAIPVDGSADTPRLAAALGPLPTGRFRVLMRCSLAPGGDHDRTYYLRRARQLTRHDGGTVAITARQGFPARRVWVDLGDSSTFGVQVPTDAAVAASSLSVYIFLWTSDGGGGIVHADSIKLIPISDGDVSSASLASYQAPSGLTAGGVDFYDADSETSWGVDPGGVVQPSFDVLTGGFPVADPAAETNILTVIATDDGGGLSGTTTTTLGSTVAVGVSYQPKYLHLPGDPDA